MGYYQGDFYAGTRGDPGFFSFLGGVARSAVGLIPGVGPALSAGLGMIKRAPKAAPAAAGMAMQSGVAMIKGGAQRLSGAILKHPVLSAAGAAGAVGAFGGAAIGRARAPRMTVDPMTGMLRHHRRRMNPCNPRALRRAVRRAHAFTKLAMKTIHLVHPKKKGKFGGFKKRKKT
jgi:hypothetical protein